MVEAPGRDCVALDDALKRIGSGRPTEVPGGGGAIFQGTECRGHREGPAGLSEHGHARLAAGEGLVGVGAEVVGGTMTADRWSMIERLYHEALDQKAEDRAVFLNQACGRDDALRHEVESLLAHDGDASFLSTPAATVGHGLAIGIGQAVGPYVISAPLGEGGMGEVYRARDTTLGRDVAIKVLPTIWASDPERLARFTREARMLAALNHPHIGAIYGVEESDGIRALVLELVEGPTLADRLVKGPLPISEALSIAKQIAEALEAAHESGIVHRDLKPANIKITPAGVVKVLDFGLAKAMADEGDRACRRRPR